MRKENRHGHTARSAGTIMVAFVIANLVGLIRQVIINRTFGTSSILDAYFAAFRVPDLLFHVIAGGALGSAFIPTGDLLVQYSIGYLLYQFFLLEYLDCVPHGSRNNF